MSTRLLAVPVLLALLIPAIPAAHAERKSSKTMTMTETKHDRAALYEALDAYLGMLQE